MRHRVGRVSVRFIPSDYSTGSGCFRGEASPEIALKGQKNRSERILAPAYDSGYIPGSAQAAERIIWRSAVGVSWAAAIYCSATLAPVWRGGP